VRLCESIVKDKEVRNVLSFFQDVYVSNASRPACHASAELIFRHHARGLYEETDGRAR
jgi:hypothetical protein